MTTLVFKWFLYLNILDHSVDPSIIAKNREWWFNAQMSRESLPEILMQARMQRLMREGRFSRPLTKRFQIQSARHFTNPQRPISTPGGK